MSDRTVKAKRKNILNLIDVFLIVLIVVALAAFISYRFILADNTVADVKLQYDIEVRNVSERLNTEKLMGDTLYDRAGVCMGTVSAIGNIQRADHSLTNAGVTYVQTTASFTVTVTCDAIRMKDGSYRVEGIVLKKGDALSLLSEDFFISGDCVRVSEVAK